MARNPPIWQRLGFKNQYVYRRATGKYTPGTTGAERAREKRGAPPLTPEEAIRRTRREARRKREEAPPVQLPARVPSTPIPGSQGRYFETHTPDETRSVLEQEARDNRKVIIQIWGDIAPNYPGDQPPRYATISQVPASIVLAYLGRQQLDTWIGLAELAMRQSGKGYSAIGDIEAVTIKSYP